MRSILLMLLATCGAQAIGQITNGSFEVNGAGTIAGWRNTCTQIDTMRDAAPGWEHWCARLPNENTQGGCWIDYLYQALPGVQNGDPLIFAGWIKHQILFGTPATGIGIHAAHIDSVGMFHFDQSAFSMDTGWVHVQFTHAYTSLLPSDTAIVLLTGGYSQFTTFYGYGLFDGIEVDGLTTSLSEPSETGQFPLIFPSPCADELRVNAIGPYVITDALGRVAARGALGREGEAIGTASLPSGWYAIVIATAHGPTLARFLKQ